MSRCTTLVQRRSLHSLKSPPRFLTEKRILYTPMQCRGELKAAANKKRQRREYHVLRCSAGVNKKPQRIKSDREENIICSHAMQG